MELLPPYLYHTTRLEAFRGILSNHNGNLVFWMSRFDQMNDPEEGAWLRTFLKRPNNIWKGKKIHPHFVLSFSDEKDMALKSRYDYGDIVLKIDTSKVPVFADFKFQKCKYSDKSLPENHHNDVIVKTYVEFALWLKSFYRKTRKWRHESEWRLVLNAQKKSEIKCRRSGWRFIKYIEKSLPHDCLKEVYILEKEGKSLSNITEVKEILKANNFDIEVKLLSLKK